MSQVKIKHNGLFCHLSPIKKFVISLIDETKSTEREIVLSYLKSTSICLISIEKKKKLIRTFCYLKDPKGNKNRERHNRFVCYVERCSGSRCYGTEMWFDARQNRRIWGKRISCPSRTLHPGMFSFGYYVRSAMGSTRLAQGYQNVDVLQGMLTGTRYKNLS
jgi:hypothetical protein